MPMQVNLLPTQFRPQPQVRIWPVVLTVVLMVNLLLTGTYWLTLFLDLGSTRNQQQSLESEIANIERRIEEAHWRADLKTAVERKSKFISDQIVDSVLWSPALTTIEQSLIPGVVLTSIGFSGEGSISITATVDSIKTAVDFWASLQTRTGLEGIWLNNAPAEGSIGIGFTGWYGREVPADDE